MSNFEIKQDAFCRFTRLRQTHKTSEFMDILMDTYEKSLEQPTGYFTVEGAAYNAPVVDTFTPEAPVVTETPTGVKVKRTRKPNVNKDQVDVDK